MNKSAKRALPFNGLMIGCFVAEKLCDPLDRYLRFRRQLSGRPTDETRNVDAIRFGNGERARQENLQNNGEYCQDSGNTIPGKMSNYSLDS